MSPLCKVNVPSCVRQGIFRLASTQLALLKFEAADKRKSHRSGRPSLSAKHPAGAAESKLRAAMKRAIMLERLIRENGRLPFRVRFGSSVCSADLNVPLCLAQSVMRRGFEGHDFSVVKDELLRNRTVAGEGVDKVEHMFETAAVERMRSLAAGRVLFEPRQMFYIKV